MPASLSSQAALERENDLLKHSLLEASLCMRQFGQALQASHQELTESCAALCRSEGDPAQHSADAAHATRVSQRQLALYLAFLGRAAGLALEQATAAEAIRSQCDAAQGGTEVQVKSATLAASDASPTDGSRAVSAPTHRRSPTRLCCWPWQRRRSARAVSPLCADHAVKENKDNGGTSGSGARFASSPPTPGAAVNAAAPSMDFISASPMPASSADGAATAGVRTPRLFDFVFR